MWSFVLFVKVVRIAIVVRVILSLCHTKPLSPPNLLCRILSLTLSTGK